MPNALVIGIPDVARVLLVRRGGIPVIQVEDRIDRAAESGDLYPSHQRASGTRIFFPLVGQHGAAIAGGEEQVEAVTAGVGRQAGVGGQTRSEEHTSELQSPMY